MVNLFDNISDRNKEKLLRYLEANYFVFKKNVNISSSVNQGNIIGIVLEGYLQIVKNDYNGNKTIIEDLEENSIFGTIMSSISNGEYDVITKEDSKVILIDFEHIINTADIPINSYNQFLKNLLQIISERIQRKNERIEILTTKTIRNKLLEYFKITAQKTNTRIIYLPFNFNDLAEYLAVDRSAMSRELKNLKDEGLIEVKGKRINLLYYYN